MNNINNILVNKEAKILDVIKTEPKQFQLVLHSIFKLSDSKASTSQLPK